MANFCTECGTKVADGAAFCGGCGKAVAGAAPAPVATPPAPQPVPQPVPQPAPQPVPTPAPYVEQQAYVAPPQQPYQQPQPQYAPGYPPPQKSGPNVMLIIMIVVAVLLAAAVAALLFMRNGTDAPIDGETAAAGAAASGQAAVEGPAVGPEVTKFVTSTANIRSMATAQDANSKVVGSLARGTQVRGVMHQGLAANSSWLKLTDGRGYVSAVNLSDGPPPPETVSVRPELPNAVWCNVATAEGNLRIRNAPGGRIIGGLARGSRFQTFNQQVDRQGNLWYNIQPVETRHPIGWVSADHATC